MNCARGSAGFGRGLLRALLASSSLAALLIGGGRSAFATDADIPGSPFVVGSSSIAFPGGTNVVFTSTGSGLPAAIPTDFNLEVYNGAQTSSPTTPFSGYQGLVYLSPDGSTLTVTMGGDDGLDFIVNGGKFTASTSGTMIDSVTFDSAATYLLTINGASVNNIIAGSATLGGASVSVTSGSTIIQSHQYTILTTSAALTDTFNPTVYYGGLRGTLTYDSDDVYLTFTLVNLLAQLPSGAPTNSSNTANAIDNFLAGGGTPPTQFDNVFSLSGAQLQNALMQLDGEDATGAQRGAFDLMDEFLGLLLDPFVDGRGDFASGGQPLGFAPDQQASLPPDIALAYAGVLKAPPPQTFAQRWTAWGSGFGGSATTNGDPTVGSNNVTTSTYGYAAGMDYHYSPDTVLGFSLAGGGTNWGLANAFGTGRSDALLAGVYGVTHQGPAYIGAALAFANNWFTTNRTALGDQMTASFQGQSYSARLEGGYRFAMPVDHGIAGVTPYAAIQVQDFQTPAYGETDLTGGGLGLSYAAMNGTDTRSELGARFDDPTMLDGMPLILRAKLAWAHDWASNPALNASFESLPGTSFTVFGAPIPHDSALTSAGAQLFLSSNWSFLAKLDGEFANGSETYGGSGTLRYTW